jgi:hypothetical protein
MKELLIKSLIANVTNIGYGQVKASGNEETFCAVAFLVADQMRVPAVTFATRFYVFVSYFILFHIHGREKGSKTLELDQNRETVIGIRMYRVPFIDVVNFISMFMLEKVIRGEYLCIVFQENRISSSCMYLFRFLQGRSTHAIMFSTMKAEKKTLISSSFD